METMALFTDLQRTAFTRSLQRRGYRRRNRQTFERRVGDVTRSVGLSARYGVLGIQWGLLNPDVSEIIWEPGYGGSVAWSFMTGTLRASGSGQSRIAPAIDADELDRSDPEELAIAFGNALDHADDVMAAFPTLDVARDEMLARAEDRTWAKTWTIPAGTAHSTFIAAACEVVAHDRPDEDLVGAVIADLRHDGYLLSTMRADRLEAAWRRKADAVS